MVSCISKATRPGDENGIFFVAKKLIGGARSLSPVGAGQVALALEVDLECIQAILESAEDNFTKILANLGSPEPACVVFTQENVRILIAVLVPWERPSRKSEKSKNWPL